MHKSLVPEKKTNEWLEFISRLGLVSISDARNIFLSGDYTQLPDLGQKSLYTAGKGKTLSLEGNLIGSKMTLDEALLLAETRNAELGFPVRDEVLAYVQYERGVFLEKFGESFNGLSLYRSAKRLAESKTLNAVVDYQLSAHELQKGTGSSIAEAQSWIKYFYRHNMHIMELVAIRRLATYHRGQEEFKEADELLMRAMDLGSQYDYPFMVEQFKNSYGYLVYSRGSFLEAREIYHDLRQGLLSKYLMATVLENLTLTYYDADEFDAASKYLSEALAHSQKYDILSRIPDEGLFMGDMHRDKLQQPELATHYYQIGSQAALKMAEYGFSLTGERLEVVERFENRPKAGYSLPESIGTDKSKTFAFALGQTWKQINDLFQFLLLQKHLESGVGISELPAKLELKTSTYYAIKRRLSQQGYNFESIPAVLPQTYVKRDMVALISYVNGLLSLSWSQANEQFEKEIIEYLFKQVGYQKTKLAEKLEISYPTVLQKTKSLKAG